MNSVVTYDAAAAVATITLNRPEKLNALSKAVVAGLREALDLAERDDDVRVVVGSLPVGQPRRDGRTRTPVPGECGARAPVGTPEEAP